MRKRRRVAGMLALVLIFSGCGAKPQIGEAPEVTTKAEPILESEEEALTERVKELYLDKRAIEEAVRTIVANRMSTTSFVAVNPREKYNITEILIDEVTGNPIVSEGVKSMLGAASEEKSVEEIVSATLQGAGMGISDYLTGEMEGAISDALGADIFSAIDFVNQWQNADSMPRILLQNIVADQKTDVAKLDAFLQQDKMSVADILELSQLVYCIHVREQELASITGESSNDSTQDYVLLEQMAGKYAQVEEEITSLATAMLSGKEWSVSGAEKEKTGETIQKMSEVLQEAEALAELSVGRIAVNYDAEGFIKAQKNTSQTGLLGGFLGNLVGALATEDLQTVEDWVQEKRAALYNQLTDGMEESYREVAEAKADYMVKTAMLNRICSAGEKLYFITKDSGSSDELAEYEKAREIYVAALEKYLFDLSCAYQFYECVLTMEQEAFLRELQMEKEAVRACVEQWDAEQLLGYTKEEKNDRYQELVELYVDSVDYLQVRGAVLGQTPGFSAGGQVMQYGEGDYRSYTNGEHIILIIRLRTGEYIYDEGCGTRNYYDMQGNPIYCRAGQDWVSFWEGEVMSYQLMNDDFLTHYQEVPLKAWEVFH